MSIAMRPFTDSPLLPPLSSLLNSPKHNSAPASPRTTPMKTPVRLPSLGSLLLNKFPTPATVALPTPVTASPVEKRAFAFISHSPSTFPMQEPDIDNAQLARRKRRRTSPGELSILQDEFLKGQTPNRARRLEIAARVSMTEKAVQIWFQNRRQTLRRQSNTQREVHTLDIPVYQQQHQIPQSHTLQHQANVSSPASSPAATPSRPPRAPRSPSTMTFRLTKHVSPVKSENMNVLMPVNQSYRTRQKPLMRVNSQPATENTHSSKENSPRSSPQHEHDRSSPSKRQPLAELSFNNTLKPKRDDDAVANLLSLKHLIE